MKCPICGSKMSVFYGSGEELFSCSNLSCKAGGFYATDNMWQELIRTRKALDVAWDGLKMIGSGDIIEHSVVGHEDDNKIFIANKTLNESKTILKQKD